MNDVWLTADTHFNHKFIAEHRGFYSVESMNEMLIDSWNLHVKRGDRVYHLGDVALGKTALAPQLLGRLTGNIHLILGNHDKVAQHPTVRNRFTWIGDYKYLDVGGQKIALCHYAFQTWRNSHHGTWHLHGHSHGSLPPIGKRLDVGVDGNNWCPWHIDEVAAYMSTRSWQQTDGHTPDTCG